VIILKIIFSGFRLRALPPRVKIVPGLRFWPLNIVMTFEGEGPVFPGTLREPPSIAQALPQRTAGRKPTTVITLSFRPVPPKAAFRRPTFKPAQPFTSHPDHPPSGICRPKRQLADRKPAIGPSAR
jgi:hypothetical protein